MHAGLIRCGRRNTASILHISIKCSSYLLYNLLGDIVADFELFAAQSSSALLIATAHECSSGLPVQKAAFERLLLLYVTSRMLISSLARVLRC